MAYLQDFLDSSAGTVLGTLLHTIGAIGLLAGLVFYVGWYNRLRGGNHDPRTFSFAVFLTYTAILANLLGGFMRTFQSDHPGLREFATSLWVQLLSIKHMFLFAGMAAAVLLFHVVAPRLLRAHREGKASRDMDHWVGVVVVAASIVVATVLGAGTTVALQTPPDDPIVEDNQEDGVAVRYQNVTGQLTSTPLVPNTASGTFEVRSGAQVLTLTLVWSDPAELVLTVEGPVDVTPDVETDAGRVVLHVEAPVPGTWRYEVSSDLAVDVAWDLSIRTAQGGDETLLTETVTIAPNTFFEINTQMPLNGTFHWDWTATEVVAFDVHSHFDDEVQYLVEETTDAHDGSFTNDREGGYSLLWDNTGNIPVTLTYRVWGEFEVDSYFPPRS